jgi:hypothetical protein
MATKKLVFDIETVGENFDQLDETTQDVLTNWIKKESGSDEEYRAALVDVKKGLGFSPLTGEIVALGVLDVDTNQGGVYFQAPNQTFADWEEDGIKFKVMTEADILKQFWTLAEQYHEFISFNGRGFDAPFMMVRSAIHDVKISKNLMPYRYGTTPQHGNAVHIDLLDQLTFYNAVRRKGNLHLWSRAFGIESPKAQGITGDDVSGLFKEGKCVDIARYNVGDLHATAELYKHWNKHLRFS